ncbi:hypothetical protein AVEN_175057-1 [Araneus ventricosus]|uniref:Uncharacterized protein n=1 Tax=Araneus ventricosus TaxID=182803 RepID=A0A4Y2MQ44_ARAVE|nr:hypothetical protein AVEN_175057-1 [Araneus ventricosus]
MKQKPETNFLSQTITKCLDLENVLTRDEVSCVKRAVVASGSEGFRFKTRFHRRSVGYVGLLYAKPGRGLIVLSLVRCYRTHPDPAYPSGFKALKSRRVRELTISSRRTPAPLSFIKSFSAGEVLKFREMGASPGVILVIWLRLTITRSVPK